MQPAELLSSYAMLLRQSPDEPAVAASVLTASLPAPDARPLALILAPHPDDECLTGALPLRLMREGGWRVVDCAVTLGGNPARRAARKTELAKACAALGFEAMLTAEEGFSGVTHDTRLDHAPRWQEMAARVAAIIAHLRPRLILAPHARDAHPAHIGTHLLAFDALAAQPGGFECAVAQTEYWQPNDAPNLMIGLAQPDAAALLAALACHAGENARNRFDARFPSYLIDNARRGSELVGGAGASAAPLDFAMLYKFGLWRGGKFTPSALNRIYAPEAALGELFD